MKYFWGFISPPLLTISLHTFLSMQTWNLWLHYWEFGKWSTPGGLFHLYCLQFHYIHFRVCRLGICDCITENLESEVLLGVCFTSIAYHFITYILEYADLECMTDPSSGFGDIIMKHNFDGDILTTMNTKDTMDRDTLDVPLNYLAPSTVDEVQSILTASQTCYQRITFLSSDCLMATTWSSINGDQWHYTKLKDR